MSEVKYYYSHIGMASGQEKYKGRLKGKLCNRKTKEP